MILQTPQPSSKQKFDVPDQVEASQQQHLYQSWGCLKLPSPSTFALCPNTSNFRENSRSFQIMKGFTRKQPALPDAYNSFFPDIIFCLNMNHTKYCIECHQFYMSRPVLIVNHLCGVNNTKCKPNTICHCLQKILGIINLQCCNYCHLLSDSTYKVQLSMTIFHYRNVGL